MDDIKLPLLPLATGCEPDCPYPDWVNDLLNTYARAAVLADRQRRGGDVVQEFIDATDALLESQERKTWTSGYAKEMTPGERTAVTARWREARAALAAHKPDDEAKGQIEALDLDNHRLRRAMQKVMARLTNLLDEDQFGNIESIVTEAGVEPPEAHKPDGGDAKDAERYRWLRDQTETDGIAIVMKNKHIDDSQSYADNIDAAITQQGEEGA